MSRPRLFILESPNAADLLRGREEAATLITSCRIVGYDVASFVLRSKTEFASTCKYIADINTQSKRKEEPPLFIHIAAHGGDDGLAFGPHNLPWRDISKYLAVLCPIEGYNGKVVLVLSACYAGRQTITKALVERHKDNPEDFEPFTYVFVTNEDLVSWPGALVAWTTFYHQIKKVSLDDTAKVKTALKRVAGAGDVNMKYFRWDKTKSNYRFHEAAK